MKLIGLSALSLVQLTHMMVLQHQCNQALIAEDYLSNPPEKLNFRLASDKEFFESFDHLDFKWWKAGSTNEAQFGLEMIDCLHFNLSEAITIQNKRNLSLEDGANELHELLSMAYASMADNYNASVEEVKKQLADGADENQILLEIVDAHRVAYVNANCIDKIFMNMVLAGFAGLDADAVYKTYIAKNVLNVFRTNHGYKDGTYIKEWFGREDNATIEDYINSNDMSQPDSLDNLNAHLEAVYATVVAAKA